MQSSMNGFGERPKFWDSNQIPPETAADKEAQLKDSGSSMNAISFGFVATAILVSMFLIMAIFEHLLRPRPSLVQSQSGDQGSMESGQPQAQSHSFGKLENLQSVANPHPSDLSVVMPGQQYPTYLAQPAPLPCTREGVYWPSHEHLFGSPYPPP